VTSGVAPPLLKCLSPALERLDAALRHRPQPVAATATPSGRDVTIVVQGPVVGSPDDPGAQRFTLRCLQSVRCVLPEAEVVLSTWRGSDVRGLPADRVVINDDPGPTPSRDASHVVNNVNRQVVTTRAGLEQASRPMALKLRSDMLLEHDGMLRLFGGWPARATELRVLRERVLLPTFYSFNPRRVYSRFPYMVSDWCHFGLTEDLREIWSTPRWDPAFEWLLGRRIVASEQWIWMSLLNRHDADAFVGRPDVVAHSELAMVNNVVVLEAQDLGVRMLKFAPHLGHQTAVYTHGEWQRLYDRLCLGAHPRGWDAQALLRTVVDRAWIRGLAPHLIGYPEDMLPSPRPVIPPRTPNHPEVVTPDGSGRG